MLRPNGRFIFTVWDSIETNPVMHVADTIVAGLFPENPPHFLARTPCGYNDKPGIERELREAGFTSVTIEEVRRESDVASAGRACDGTLPGNTAARRDRGLCFGRSGPGDRRRGRRNAQAFRRRFVPHTVAGAADNCCVDKAPTVERSMGLRLPALCLRQRRRHARMDQRGGLDETGGQRRRRPLAMMQAEIEQRLQAEPVDRLAVAGLGRDVRQQAMIERGRDWRAAGSPPPPSPRTRRARPAPSPCARRGSRRRSPRIRGRRSGAGSPADPSDARHAARARGRPAPALRAIIAASAPEPGPTQSAPLPP